MVLWYLRREGVPRPGVGSCRRRLWVGSCESVFNCSVLTPGWVDFDDAGESLRGTFMVVLFDPRYGDVDRKTSSD